MCGIVGVVNLRGKRSVPHAVLQRMADALFHRGPDEDGYLEEPGISLASRRLSIVGLADGRQPISNEDGSVSVVYNGELFDYPERRAALEGRGHRFATHCDTELIPHLWEDHGEEMMEHLRGQFALALWDRRRQQLVIARDRFGICPLYWTRQTKDGGDWLLFASEIKALLASGMVEPRAEPRGIDHAFTFFGLPGTVTCFAGVQALLPGRYLRLQLDPAADGAAARIVERTYWEIDFPDRGDEDRGRDDKKVVDGLESVLLGAVERRLRADVPVVSYLSGGVDSTMVVALASHVRGQSIPSFTIRIPEAHLDETSEATLAARHIGTDPILVNCGPNEILETYPRLIQAAEGPVIDTSCAALLLLAQEVHAHGYKVALTGEGSDEWLAGYPWYKLHRLLGLFDFIPGLHISRFVRRAYLKLTGAPRFPWKNTKRIREAVAGDNPWLDLYGMVSLAKWRFYSPSLRESLGDYLAYSDLGLNVEKMRRWHPMNRAHCLAGRIHLPGLLLNGKGDRVAMHSSVETRYPFLDEEVFAYLSQLHPRWTLRRFTDKYVLRKLAERWLPRQIAWRSKAMFRAPFDSFHSAGRPAYVNQLLSEESLRKTGYFDPQAVSHWRQGYQSLRDGSTQRTSIEMGLVAVLSTQLWHHTYIDGSLADLPSLTGTTPRLAAIAG
jgi:asparagine synthase (glutamine-hydrolysing)